MDIYPKFKIGEKVFIELNNNPGIVIGYTFQDTNIWYSVRYVLNHTYSTSFFHETELMERI